MKRPIKTDEKYLFCEYFLDSTLFIADLEEYIGYLETRPKRLISSMGKSTIGDVYTLRPDNKGRWWIEHKYVGSSELLIDFLKEK